MWMICMFILRLLLQKYSNLAMHYRQGETVMLTYHLSRFLYPSFFLSLSSSLILPHPSIHFHQGKESQSTYAFWHLRSKCITGQHWQNNASIQDALFVKFQKQIIYINVGERIPPRHTPFDSDENLWHRTIPKDSCLCDMDCCLCGLKSSTWSTLSNGSLAFKKQPSTVDPLEHVSIYCSSNLKGFT